MNEPPPSWIHEPEFDVAIENNWLFKLRRERYRSRKSGRSHDYYVLRLTDAVNVVAVTPDRRILLVEQFRAGSGRDSLETPGGLLNPGEDPLSAGARELLEETGYAGDPPTVVSKVWSNPSLLSSRSTSILIENARPVAPTAFDEHEELSLRLVPEAEIPAMIADGRIDHALAVVGLLAWMARRDDSAENRRSSRSL